MNDHPASLPARIRELRTQRKLSQDRLAAAIGVAKSTVQSFESGKLIPQEGTAQRLDEAFGTGQEIQGLAKSAREDLRPWLRPWVEHERRAILLRTWEPMLMPGLLQCEAYMRAVFEGDPDNDAAQVDELIAQRLSRQAATLDRPNPALLNAVVGEAALRVGLPSPVLKAQLDHLLNIGDRPHVRIRVLPAGLGLHLGLSGAFVIASLQDGRRIGYLDDPLNGHVATSLPDLTRLEVVWMEVETLALSAVQSRDAILRMFDEHE